MAGSSNGGKAAGRFDLPSPDEEIIAAICDNDPQTAARWLREFDTLGRYALDALADMLDGGISGRSSQQHRQPVVLKIAAARGPGRPRKGDVRSVIFRTGRQRKTPAKTPGWQYKIALRVQTLIYQGQTRKEAIEEARRYFPFAAEGQKKRMPHSFSDVEKAYDGYRKKLRSKSFKPERRVLK